MIENELRFSRTGSARRIYPRDIRQIGKQVELAMRFAQLTEIGIVKRMAISGVNEFGCGMQLFRRMIAGMVRDYPAQEEKEPERHHGMEDGSIGLSV